jgi:hypothetical protein
MQTSRAIVFRASLFMVPRCHHISTCTTTGVIHCYPCFVYDYLDFILTRHPTQCDRLVRCTLELWLRGSCLFCIAVFLMFTSFLADGLEAVTLLLCEAIDGTSQAANSKSRLLAFEIGLSQIGVCVLHVCVCTKVKACETPPLTWTQASAKD